jgi:hypothetical protein
MRSGGVGRERAWDGKLGRRLPKDLQTSAAREVISNGGGVATSLSEALNIPIELGALAVAGGAELSQGIDHLIGMRAVESHSQATVRSVGAACDGCAAPMTCG